ncbi:putative lysr family regulatory protein [Podospora fimiseda]|uniref:Lysr family regulatory protein n=1 Tax=Podospora fimiseda TaxID=252190 RepID=A0AAN6YT19_9PEZI|nr:putative lysr family regulatory protein [Podospora fimiseda]
MADPPHPRRVVAARFFDDTPMVRTVMRWVIRVDVRLDADKLHKSLTELFEIGNWRRLGGRLRLNKQKKLEIHIPETFSAEHPAVRFEHLVLTETNIGDHPLGAQLPQPTDGPSIQGGDAFRKLSGLGGDKYPETLADYLNSDEPPFALQVISFRDATLVFLTFPHAVSDALGLSALIENWCKVLAGRQDEVLPIPEHDPMDLIDAEEEGTGEKHILDNKRISGFGLVIFGLYFLWDLLFGPKMQTKLLFLPSRSVEALKKRAISDLQDAEKKKPAPFVSEGDIMTSLGIKSIASSLGDRSTRSLAVLNVFELRGRFPNSNIFDTSKFAHVQNAFFVLTCILSGQEARKLSLGQTALRMRETVVEQTSELQVRALTREHRAALEKTGRPVVFAETNSVLAPMSNWSKAGFYDIVDFGPAVLDDTDSNGRRGKPSFFSAFDASPKINPTHRNVWNILGKDPQGNYWINGMLSAASWEKIEEELKSLGESCCNV